MSERSTAGLARTVARRLAMTIDGSEADGAVTRWTDAPWASERSVEAGLRRLATAYRLSNFERDVIALTGLAEEHEVLSHAARLLHPHAEPWMSTSAICRVLDLDPEGRRQARRTLQSGTAVTRGLLVADRVGPFPEWSWRLVDGLWDALCGIDTSPSDRSPTPSARAADAAELASLLDGEPCVIVVTGGASRPVADVVAAVRSWFARLERGCTVVHPLRSPEAGPPASTRTLPDRPTMRHAVAAVISDSVPVVVGPLDRVPLEEHPGHIVLCVQSASGLELDDRPSVIVELGQRDLAETVTMWESVAPELVTDATTLAGLLRVDRTTATRAMTDARLVAQSTGTPLDARLVAQHVRRRTDVGLPPAVRLVRPTAAWDSLVTTDENDERMRSIVGRVDQQTTVLNDWGFGRYTNRGVRSLFSGPPGTGKTLATHVLAATLGLDLLVVDLSSLVSKWLGETEKHISEVFEAADRRQAVLFFDEAEAIFGQRTDGSDAQGRWANLETAHLLNRIDAFDGLIVLATNLRGNIDEAFVRRLDVIVDFDEPDATLRARLWRHHLPAGPHLDRGIDPDQLAELYPVTGGVIRNASLAAAFAAAVDREAISQHRLLRAVEQEYRKAGRSFPGLPPLNDDRRALSQPDPMPLLTH